MSNADLFELRATPGPEGVASCGCAFLYAMRKMMDAREGRWLVGKELVVVPCSEEHIDLAREVAESRAGDEPDTQVLADLAVAMSERVAS